MSGSVYRQPYRRPPPRLRWVPDTLSQDVEASLTGVSAAGTVGTFTPDSAALLAGNQSAASVGGLVYEKVTTYDSFTDTDNTTLASHVSDTGATWAHPSYATSANNLIISGVLTKDANAVQALYYESATQSANCWNRQRVTVLSVNSGQRARLILRLDTAAENYYLFQYSFATNLWGIFSNNGGVVSAALGTTFSETLSANDVRTMEFRITGSSLEGYVDGVLRCFATDTSITAAGKSGLAIVAAGSSTTNVSIDNYISASFIDSSIALTGVSSTTSTGSLNIAQDAALTGQSSAVGIGMLTPTADKALAGNAGTSALGSTTLETNKALSGNQSTTSTGTLVVDRLLVLLGVSTISVLNSASPGTSITASGFESTSATGAVTPIAGSGDITLALSGVSATLTSRTPDISRDQALAGISSPTATGAVEPVSIFTLSGAQATTAVGALTPASSFALSGNVVSVSAGSISVSASVALSGVSSTGQLGSVIAETDSSVTLQLSGVSTSCSAGNVALQVETLLNGAESVSAIGSMGLSKGGSAVLAGVQTAMRVDSITAETLCVVIGNQAAAQIDNVVAVFALPLVGAITTGSVDSLSVSIDVGLPSLAVGMQLGSFILVGSVARRKQIAVSSEGRSARVSAERRSSAVSSETRVK